MTVRKLQDLQVEGKRILVRVDFNVPLDQEGNVTDDTRLRASLPTLRTILECGGSLVLMSHLGRPEGQKKPEMSLAPIALALERLLGCPVQMAQDCVGKVVYETARDLQPGDVLLLENLRFHMGEQHPDDEPGFVEALAELGDSYVNDAFGTAHRKHASTYFVPKLFGAKAAAGLLLQREVAYLGNAILEPARPFAAIIGGAKVSSKLGVLRSLLDKADSLLIGGGMAFTFLKAQGISIGGSLVEEQLVGEAKEILEQAGDKLLLPEDIVIAQEISEDARTQTVVINAGIPAGWKGLDIGERTIASWNAHLKQARTILWNGPLGVFEVKPFDKGTLALAKSLAHAKALTVVGGGDSVSAVNQAGLADHFDHLSTGGGASLEYLECGTLPGLQALE